MPLDAQLSSIMAELATIDPVGIARRRELGEINFEAALSALEQMKAFFSEAQTVNWDAVPPLVIDTVRAEVQGLWGQLKQMTLFRVSNQTTPNQARDAIQRNVLSSWSKCYVYMVPHIAYLKARSETPDLRDIVSGVRGQAASIVDEIRKEAGEVTKSLADLNKQASNERMKVTAVLKSVTDAAKDVGVTQEAAEFTKLARRYLQGAAVWLIAAFLFGAWTFCYAGLILHNTSLPRAKQDSLSLLASGTNTPGAQNEVSGGAITTEATSTVFSLIRTILPRLIRVTLLLTAFVFCLKNFSALSHNYIVNRHRATALSTFQTFVTGSRDEQIKSAVLLQASQAIFSPQPSAFLKSDSDSPQVTPVYEIAKTLVTKGKD